jgi:hypothetical protein
MESSVSKELALCVEYWFELSSSYPCGEGAAVVWKREVSKSWEVEDWPAAII